MEVTQHLVGITTIGRMKPSATINGLKGFMRMPVPGRQIASPSTLGLMQVEDLDVKSQPEIWVFDSTYYTA